MDRLFKGIIYLVLTVCVAVMVLYFEDPWLWRRYAGFLVSADASLAVRFNPTEVVKGDSGEELPIASAASRTIAIDALRSAEEYAAEFDSTSLIVVHKGVVQSEWYAEGWDRERLTEAPSIHKVILSIVVGHAIYTGKIGGPDTPISTYITEWKNDPRGDITIENLLTMSSGLESYGMEFNPFRDSYKWLFAGDVLPLLLNTPKASWAPGSQFENNDVNAELLTLIIERATQRRYAEYVSEALWQVLGVKDAHVWLDQEGGLAHGSCCFGARSIDWAKVGYLLLHKGEWAGKRVVPAAWVDRMITASPKNEWYGYFLWLGYEDQVYPAMDGNPDRMNLTPFDARDTFYASGRGGQSIFVVPSKDLVIVRFGPGLGRQPLKDGWQVSYLVNTVLTGVINKSAPESGAQPETPSEYDSP